MIPIEGICNTLSLSSGGSFGINQIAILNDLNSKEKLPTFDTITGVSTGALTASYLGYFDDIQEGLDKMKSLYFNLHNSDIYKVDWKDTFEEYSILDSTPLKNLITNLLTSLDKSNNIKKKVYIGSTNVNEGTFQQFSFHHLNLEDKIKVLMASSAIPLIFPPVMINNTLYADGGVMLNEIIYPDDDICNILIINAHNQLEKINNVTSFMEYLKRIIKIVSNNFDDDINKMICRNNRINMKYCYPTSPLLDEFNTLDFEHSKRLYNITLNNYNCLEIKC